MMSISTNYVVCYDGETDFYCEGVAPLQRTEIEKAVDEYVQRGVLSREHAQEALALKNRTKAIEQYDQKLGDLPVSEKVRQVLVDLWQMPRQVEEDRNRLWEIFRERFADDMPIDKENGLRVAFLSTTTSPLRSGWKRGFEEFLKNPRTSRSINLSFSLGERYCIAKLFADVCSIRRDRFESLLDKGVAKGEISSEEAGRIADLEADRLAWVPFWQKCSITEEISKKISEEGIPADKMAPLADLLARLHRTRSLKKAVGYWEEIWSLLDAPSAAPPGNGLQEELLQRGISEKTAREFSVTFNVTRVGPPVFAQVWRYFIYEKSKGAVHQDLAAGNISWEHAQKIAALYAASPFSFCRVLDLASELSAHEGAYRCLKWVLPGWISSKLSFDEKLICVELTLLKELSQDSFNCETVRKLWFAAAAPGGKQTFSSALAAFSLPTAIHNRLEQAFFQDFQNRSPFERHIAELADSGVLKLEQARRVNAMALIHSTPAAFRMAHDALFSDLKLDADELKEVCDHWPAGGYQNLNPTPAAGSGIAD